MRKIIVFATLFVALCLGVVHQNVRAQSNNLAQLYFVETKAGHAADLEAAIQEHAQWRKQNGDPWTWMVYQVTNGDNLGDFIIRSGDHAWAHFDAYDAGFGPQGGAHWGENVMPHVESMTSAITAVDTTNVNWHPNEQAVTLLSVTTLHLKPGKSQAFEQAVEKFHKVIKEHSYPAHYAFEWVVNGTGAGAVHLIGPFENWAAMEEPDEAMGPFLMRVMGQEEAMKLFEEFESTYHDSESMVLRVRPDLSVMPGM